MPTQKEAQLYAEFHKIFYLIERHPMFQSKIERHPTYQANRPFYNEDMDEEDSDKAYELDKLRKTIKSLMF